METNKLTWRTKFGFGIGDVGGNGVFTIMAFWVQPYLIETIGLLPALAGTAVLIAKIWDAVIDPIIGPLSDRTRTRLGRRRPFLLFGGIFAFVAMIIMFFNPHLNTSTQQIALFVWGVLMYCILCTAYSLFNIPYAALTPDLTDDYHQQTDLNTIRMFCAGLGTLMGIAFLPVVGLFTPQAAAPGMFADKSQGYLAAGVIFGFLIMAFTLITFFTVREKPAEEKPAAKLKDLIASYARVLKNKPYRIVLLTYAVNLIGITIISSNMQLYFKYIFNQEEMSFIALAALVVVNIVFIPIWNPVIKRIGKNTAYAGGLFLITAVTIVVFFLAPVLGVVFMLVMMGIAGIGLAATYSAPYAMIPDTIQYEQLKSGKREEGSYYGLWTFFSQIGQALAGFIGGFVLQIMLFKNNTPVQAPEAITGIRLLLGPIPAVFLVIAGVLILFYPISEKFYREMMSNKRS